MQQPANLPKPHGAHAELGHSVNGSAVSGVADWGSAFKWCGESFVLIAGYWHIRICVRLCGFEYDGKRGWGD